MFKNRNATSSFRTNLLNPPQNSHKTASVVLLNPRPVPVNHSMGQELRSSPKRRQLAATSTAGAGCSAARPPLGWVPISPMSNPHYCPSISCRHVKRTPRRSRSLKCFSHFCSTSFSFIKSHSLPEPDIWRLKVFVTPWQCLSLDRITSFYWSWVSDWVIETRGNLMLQLSEPFPRREVKPVPYWVENSDTIRD